MSRRVATPRRVFGASWWGQAWIDALEQRARLDPNRLPRGRTYARKGRVGTLQVEPGMIRASVRGSRIEPYEVRVRVRVFSDGEWERLLDAVAGRAGHTAALLDGELPPEVVSDAASAGVELLPGAGEIGPRCSCPDWADPCKHAAAVVYLVSDVLDADPFSLLLLRGRSRDEVLAGLRRRRATSSRRMATIKDPAVDRGVVAREALGRTPAALPIAPLPPRHPGEAVPLAVDPPAASGIRARDLAALANDAACRAWELSVGEGDGGLTLDHTVDLVRRVAAWWEGSNDPQFRQVAGRAGLRPADLVRLTGAWQVGGADAVEVLDDLWSPDPEAIEEGRQALSSAGPVRARGNRLSVAGGGVQLRLARSGSWYRFERAGQGWTLTAGPAADPAELRSPQL